MTIIKIVSFPFRLVLFVIIALLTSVIWGFNHTVVTFFQVGSAIVSAIGKVFSAMTLGGVIIQAVWELIDNGKIDSLKNTIILLLLIIGLEVFFNFFLLFFRHCLLLLLLLPCGCGHFPRWFCSAILMKFLIRIYFILMIWQKYLRFRAIPHKSLKSSKKKGII